MFAVFALLSALWYGAADFLGGVTAKRANTVAVVVGSHLSGLLLLLVMFPFLPQAAPVRATRSGNERAFAAGEGGIRTVSAVAERDT